MLFEEDFRRGITGVQLQRCSSQKAILQNEKSGLIRGMASYIEDTSVRCFSLNLYLCKLY